MRPKGVPERHRVASPGDGTTDLRLVLVARGARGFASGYFTVVLGVELHRLALSTIEVGIVLGAVVVALVRNFSVSYEAAAGSGIAGQLRAFERAAQARPSNETLRSFSYQFLRTHPIGSGDAVVISLAGSGRVVTRRYQPPGADPRGPPPRSPRHLASARE